MQIDDRGVPDCSILKANRERLGYIGAHAEAERRLKRGEEQVWCPRCERWPWPDEKAQCDREEAQP